VVALSLQQQQRLHLVPGAGVHDGVMFAGVHLLPVAKVAEIGDIAEELAEGVAGKRSAAA
jgi:hypothetical protein